MDFFSKKVVDEEDAKFDFDGNGKLDLGEQAVKRAATGEGDEGPDDYKEGE